MPRDYGPAKPVPVLSRQLQCKSAKNPTVQQGLVRLWVEDCTTNWRCRYELENIPFVLPATGHCSGVDAIQALTLTFQLMASLFNDAANYGYLIWWMDEGDFGGFGDTFENHPGG